MKLRCLKARISPRRVFKHGGWERMGLRNRSRTLAPGNRLQPLDELAGAKKASPYGGVLPPSPYASLRKCKRFLGNIRTTSVLKSALQVCPPLQAFAGPDVLAGQPRGGASCLSCAS